MDNAKIKPEKYMQLLALRYKRSFIIKDKYPKNILNDIHVRVYITCSTLATTFHSTHILPSLGASLEVYELL